MPMEYPWIRFIFMRLGQRIVLRISLQPLLDSVGLKLISLPPDLFQPAMGQLNVNMGLCLFQPREQQHYSKVHRLQILTLEKN